jgi:hypothetical protein
MPLSHHLKKNVDARDKRGHDGWLIFPLLRAKEAAVTMKKTNHSTEQWRGSA